MRVSFRNCSRARNDSLDNQGNEADLGRQTSDLGCQTSDLRHRSRTQGLRISWVAGDRRCCGRASLL